MFHQPMAIAAASVDRKFARQAFAMIVLEFLPDGPAASAGGRTRANAKPVDALSSSARAQLRPQPCRNRPPQHFGCAHGSHHADMPERGPQDGRRAERRRQWFGRVRGNDTVAARHHDKGGPSQQLWAHRIACDPPQAASGFVFAVPGTPAVARHPEGQRDAIIDPILESDEPTSLVTRGIEGGKPAEFAFC
jgi:hypothetical protein